MTPSTTATKGHGDNSTRAHQDTANGQNLLLLLSRGHWSTGFLQATTRAYWDWEHNPVNSKGSGPWPGSTLTDADYAPAPNGTYLSDGMVALMAALTANPEAAGWAFTDFQPTITTLNYDGADHPIGSFARYVFFEHRYAESADSGTNDSGMTAAVTALMSAIQATGGSYSDNAIGPMADAFTLQGYQDAMASGHWYDQLAEWAGTWGHFVLDALGMIPVLGIVPDGVSAAWSAIEGDWTGAGLSAVGMIPFVGAVAIAGKLVKDGIKAEKLVSEGLAAGRLIDRAGNRIDETTDAGKLLAKATSIEEGIFDFDNADGFLAAVEKPVRGVTYKFGATTYELAPDGKTLTHVSGPDKDVIARGGRNEIGHIASGQVRAESAKKEELGLLRYEEDARVPVERTQVKARVEGRENSRMYDGLALKPDGTYEGIEVKSGAATRDTNQAAFDELVSYESPATAKLNGETIRITSVAPVVQVD